MHTINLITSPDKLFNNNRSFLLIGCRDSIKEEFQTHLESWNAPLNIYIYDNPDEEENIDWLLSVAHIADIVIFDIDNSTRRVRDLASFIVANTNTYWLTNDTNPVYTNISVKRVYTLDFLIEDGGNFAQESK